jgi:putative PIN family toxin of toxin-antitoxin system
MALPRVVLDTNVIVSALASSSGASAELLRLAIRRRLLPVVTPALALEYEDVLSRAKIRSLVGLDAAEVGDFMDAMISVSLLTASVWRYRPQLADPGDEIVLEAALSGAAHAIVTFNKADFILSAYFGIAVVTPGEFMRLRP